MTFETAIRGLQADYTRTMMHPTYTTQNRIQKLKITLQVTKDMIERESTPYSYLPELRKLSEDLIKSIVRLA